MTTTHKPPQSPTLLTLPSELRHLIFNLSLLPSPSTKPTIQTSSPTYLSLQLTCHHIKTETYLLPFHAFPLSIPVKSSSNVSSILQFLRRLQERQIWGTRYLDLEVLGIDFDAETAGKVFKWLKEGREGVYETWERRSLSREMVFTFANSWGEGWEGELERRHWGLQKHEVGEKEGNLKGGIGSELREITITVTARHVAVSSAESAVGIRQMLDLETSLLFRELIDGVVCGGFGGLRKVVVELVLWGSLKGEYSTEFVEEWKWRLWGKLNTRAVDLRKVGCDARSKIDGDEAFCEGRRREVDVAVVAKPRLSAVQVGGWP